MNPDHRHLPVVLCLLGLLVAISPVLAEDAPAKARGFDPSLVDRGVAPCDDFYQYACGGWIANNPVPADLPSWGRFNELHEENTATLRSLLEEAAEPAPDRDPAAGLAGDLFAACMDEAAAEEKGADPIQAELVRLAAIQRKDGLPEAVASLHRNLIHRSRPLKVGPQLAWISRPSSSTGTRTRSRVGGGLSCGGGDRPRCSRMRLMTHSSVM